MNEETLGTLFAALPKQCVVLLEDIDTAGLTHTRDATRAPAPDGTTTPTIPQNIGNGTTVATPSGRISLSALLNIIDGVAATEGRILIMTTNHLDKLDDALIRPGRVDMTVRFDLANAQMIASIFRSIFATLEADDLQPISTISKDYQKLTSDTTKEEIATRILSEKKLKAELEEQRLTEEARIQAMGEKIATLIPSMTFSPAEIQGYFLKWKRQPELAIENALNWVEKTNTENKKRENLEIIEKEKTEREEREGLEKKEQEKNKKEKEEKVQAEQGKEDKNEKIDAGTEVSM